MVSGSGVIKKRVLIDARHHMLGRLASIIAKELLNGQRVVSAATQTASGIAQEQGHEARAFIDGA